MHTDQFKSSAYDPGMSREEDKRQNPNRHFYVFHQDAKDKVTYERDANGVNQPIVHTSCDICHQTNFSRKAFPPNHPAYSYKQYPKCTDCHVAGGSVKSGAYFQLNKFCRTCHPHAETCFQCHLALGRGWPITIKK